MVSKLRVEPCGSFSLAAAGRFLSNFPPADHQGMDSEGVLRLAFAGGGFAATQAAEDGPVEIELFGSASIEQVERILGLEHDARPLVPILEREPPLAAAWEASGHLRQVSFSSPYEAAAWSIIALRLRQAQGVRVRQRIEERLGERIEVAGLTMRTFPTPERLLELREVEGLSPVKVERLHGVARAELEDRLDPYALRELPPGEALAQLQEIPGLGPFYSALVLVRATGTADTMIPLERLRETAAKAYGLTGVPSETEYAELAERWRPFRTWAAVLLRATDD